MKDYILLIQGENGNFKLRTHGNNKEQAKLRACNWTHVSMDKIIAIAEWTPIVNYYFAVYRKDQGYKNWSDIEQIKVSLHSRRLAIKYGYNLVKEFNCPVRLSTSHGYNNNGCYLAPKELNSCVGYCGV